ncbi:hypothetical protein HPB48_011089 [Haemaphysalis longicornis]|uniref:Uncharacterized protein n=1 Tax=Haemaphysalis longicornis TaxID=44386 RepID=A0A9J6GS19_HAELO|nr:hypothetical protein HPB48_011089 [Haemaphysalis longicornis]
MAEGQHALMPALKIRTQSVELLCSWILEAWGMIIAVVIVKSFKKTGISNALDATDSSPDILALVLRSLPDTATHKHRLDNRCRAKAQHIPKINNTRPRSTRVRKVRNSSKQRHTTRTVHDTPSVQRVLVVTGVTAAEPAALVVRAPEEQVGQGAWPRWNVQAGPACDEPRRAAFRALWCCQLGSARGRCLGEAPGAPAQEAASRSSQNRVKRVAA